MLSNSDIKYIEDNSGVKILLLTKDIDLERYLWETNKNEDYYVVSLDQGQKCSVLNIDYKSIKSYSYEIFFCVSGWSEVPIIPSFRALPIMTDNTLYKDETFYTAVRNMIEKYHSYRYVSYGRPLYLRKDFNIDKCKIVLSRLLLNYWFREGYLRLPIDIFEVLNIINIPKDLLCCTEIVLSDIEIDMQISLFIADILIEYNTAPNQLCCVADIVVPETEFHQLKSKLVVENQFRLHQLMY